MEWTKEEAEVLKTFLATLFVGKRLFPSFVASKSLKSILGGFYRGKHDGQVILRRHKFQNESCVPAADHALRCAQGVPPSRLSPRHSARGKGRA